MPYQQTIGLDLGGSQTGLVLSAQLKNTVGVNVGGAIASGFVELGAGNYAWTYAAFPDAFRGVVVFSAAGVVKTLTSINPPGASVERTIGLGLGQSQGGLTLSAQLKDSAGVNVGGPITTGFVDYTLGNYSWTYAAFPDNFRGVVVFSAGAVVKAIETINGEVIAPPTASADLRPALDPFFVAFGVDATATPPGGPSTPTVVIVEKAAATVPPSGDPSATEQRTVIHVRRDQVPSLPSGTVIVVTEGEDAGIYTLDELINDDGQIARVAVRE